MRVSDRLFIVPLLAVALTTPAPAQDWPQYRGPNRDDVSAEKKLLQQWPPEGPTRRWTYADAGVGYAGPAIVGDRLYTLGARGADEFLIALCINGDNAAKQAWAHRVGPTFQFSGNNWSAGPSATPTVDGDHIFALGGNGDLVCVNCLNGKEVWRINLPADMAAEINPIGGGPKKLGWGFTWSPLIDGERLICLPGGPKGTVAALDKRTGKVIWRTAEATDQAAYTSPMVATIGGVRQYVVLTNQGLLGVAAADGKLLWSHRRAPAYRTEVINSPIVQNDKIFVTVGANQGCELVQVSRDDKGVFSATRVFENKNLMNHHGNVILLNGHLYGHSQGGGLTCLKFDTGEVVWSERRKVPSGALTYADNRFYNLSERDGTVQLIEASPVGWTEHGRLKLSQASAARKPKGGVWTPPVVARGRLFLRDQERLYCYDLTARN